MEMTAYSATIRKPLDTLFGTVNGEAYLFNLSPDEIQTVVSLLTDNDYDGLTLTIATDSRSFSDALSNFDIGATAAEHIDSGHLRLIETDDVDTDSRFGRSLVSENLLAPLLSTNDSFGAPATDDDEFTSEAFVEAQEIDAQAEKYNLRTPPYSEVEESLNTELGEETTQSFTEGLDAAKSARGETTVDGTTLALLAGAQREDLFYDVARWGEDTEVASKATFSRVKQDLEKADIIETENVPTDVGRPRQRLLLTDRFEGRDMGQLVTAAESVLN